MKGEILLEINGEEQKLTLDKGYAVVDRKWESGDEITLSLPMEIRRVISDDRVEENMDRVALERGPILYCVEGHDNRGLSSNIILPDELQLSERHIGDFLGGISVIEGDHFTAIPYLAWLNRGAGEMDVWIPRSLTDLRKGNSDNIITRLN